jgi:hypothetical protein
MKEKGVLLQDAFDKPTKIDQYLKQRFWNEEGEQKVLGVISRLWKKKSKSFQLDDLKDAYADDMHARLCSKVVNRCLVQFVSLKILVLETDTIRNRKEWSVHCIEILDGVLNPELSSYM